MATVPDPIRVDLKSFENFRDDFSVIDKDGNGLLSVGDLVRDAKNGDMISVTDKFLQNDSGLKKLFRKAHFGKGRFDWNVFHDPREAIAASLRVLVIKSDQEQHIIDLAHGQDHEVKDIENADAHGKAYAVVAQEVNYQNPWIMDGLSPTESYNFKTIPGWETLQRYIVDRETIERLEAEEKSGAVETP